MCERDCSFGVIPIYEGEGARRFLLIQHHAGHWGFPKGHRETGESPVDAAVRELAEETGLDDISLIDAAVFTEQYLFTRRSGKRIHKTVTYFLGRVHSSQVDLQPDEIQDFHWDTAEQTRLRLTFPEAQQLFDRVLVYLDQTAAH